MARTESVMIPLGTRAPDFQLPDVTTGETLSPVHFRDRKGLLVMFICQHCPFVKHIEPEIARLDRDYRPQGLGMIAISANSTLTHPQDSPEFLQQQAQRLGFQFPYCFDATQAVAKAYNAVCTPDFFLFDADQCLVYRGQLDDSRPGNDIPVTGKDLRAAIEAVLADRPVNPEQKPSIGCNIKWHPETHH
ncbi:MAG: thioredoxin family protein [Prochlorothrix sp.]|nr:thioredoxin family protein [Prochlorothrix sp.]